MTLYLLDENVLRAMRPGGDANVAAWLATVDDDQLRLSAMTFFEKRRGWERQRRKCVDAGTDTSLVERRLAELDLLEAEFRGRIYAVEGRVVSEWARLLGQKDKNQIDAAIAATARVHDLVIVSRNVRDFEGRDVSVLDPFRQPFIVRRV